MIDAEDLLLFEDPADERVDLLGRRTVLPSGFSSTTRDLGVTSFAAARFAQTAVNKLGAIDRKMTRT